MIDIFYFAGPSYQDVVRQYHRVIGTPKLIKDIWVHGFVSKSNLYANYDLLETALGGYKKSNIPVEIIGIPDVATINQYNFTYTTDLEKATEAYKDLKWIIPWSYNVPKEGNDDLINTALASGNIVTTNNGYAIETVSNDTSKGYCFDYFNPKIVDLFKDSFHNMHYIKRATLWLSRNSP